MASVKFDQSCLFKGKCKYFLMKKIMNYYRDNPSLKNVRAIHFWPNFLDSSPNLDLAALHGVRKIIPSKFRVKTKKKVFTANP